MIFKYLPILLLFISLNCGIIGTKKEDDNQKLILGLLALNSSNSVSTINFALDSGSIKDVGCSGYISSNTVSVSGGSQVSLKDARVYIHDVKLIKTNGSTVPFVMSSDGINQNSYSVNGNTYNVALLDFADTSNNCSSGLYGTATTATINTKISGRAASGAFSGVEFTIGVPEDLNHQDDTTLAAPLNSGGMYWSWNGGFKFMKIEFINGSTNNAWHIGSSSCTNSVCTYKNRSTVKVTKSSGNFNPSVDYVTLDLQALFNGTDTTTTGLSCHAGPQANATCETIGSNMGVVRATGESSGIQSAFKIR